MRMLPVAIVIAALAAGGCSFGGAGTGAGTTAGTITTLHHHRARAAVDLVGYRGHGVSFSYPAAWRHHRPGFISTMSEGILDLSTQRMTDPCHTHGNETDCGWPLRRLRPGGVVVMWTIDGMPMLNDRPAPGIHVKVTRPGYCRRYGGDETIEGRFVTQERTIFLVAACLRGPGVGAGEDAFRAMLASARPA